jgi:hypothetical protein
MVTIHNMEVRFDVEGERDEVVFARLFELHIRRWARDHHESQVRDRRSEQDRQLGPRRNGGAE